MATVHTLRGTHPCFSPGARGRVGRLHLPVAPRATSRVRFAANPAATPAIGPDEALVMLENVLADGTDLGIVGIVGPGDPLATPEVTLRTLRMIREAHPDLPLCLTTNGLGAAHHAAALAELDLSHVTVLVDAVDPKVAEMIYAWIRPGKRNLRLPEAAEILVEEQAAAIEAFALAGIPVKVNTTVYRGSNEAHVRDVAQVVSELGASIMAVIPYRASTGEEDYLNVQPGMGIMREAREAAALYMELMPEIDHCGWNMVGLESPGADANALGVTTLPKPHGRRVNVAVASGNGMDVDLHLGHAKEFMVYGPREDGLPCLLGTRMAPPAGGGNSRWDELALTLSDCFALLAASAGENPRSVLSGHGLSVLVTEAEVEGAVDVLYGGGKKGKGKKN